MKDRVRYWVFDRLMEFARRVHPGDVQLSPMEVEKLKDVWECRALELQQYDGDSSNTKFGI